MLMSKSRLEKFLYALYSLDSSDLPNPLSRIEELYKCLVTGDEAPTFEPLSRVEKYLMAILGSYDVELLPNPLSRVEVLLYKLATGDDNLDDVKSFLSEHEELLAEIIRNGGVGGNIDIEYVLHTLSSSYNTLYNTAKKPVKSAILKGQTLVNIKGNQVTIGVVGRQVEYLVPTVKPNTRYLITYDLESTSGFVGIGFLKNTSTWSNNLEEQGLKGQFILNSGDEPNYFRIGGLPNTVTTVKGLNIIEYQEGMENWDIPYFEGMKSVQMPVLTTTGKNLFNYFDLVAGAIIWDTSNNVNIFEDGWYQERTDGIGFRLRKCIKVKPNTKYYAYFPQEMHVIQYKANGDLIKGSYPTISTGYVTTSSKTHYINLFPSGGISSVWDEAKRQEYQNCYISESEAMTSYEPYKSNILSCNEEIELRGIGNVQDTLDCLTGEVTKRILEYSITGDEGWTKHGTSNTFFTMDGIVKYSDNRRNVISDKFIGKSIPSNTWLNNMEICVFGSKIGIGFDGTLEELIEYLKLNKPRIFYVDEEKSVKTVDLSVVDQDENDTKLSTFDDTTHVILSSEGLIPEAELEVATKNEEVLNTMSFEMDDISTTQNALQETSNTQSENVDATMLATTEIYEGLL